MRNVSGSWMTSSTNDRRVPQSRLRHENVLVSGHFWKGPPYRCLLAVEAGLAILVISDPILTELGDKRTDKFSLSKSEVDPIVERLRARAELTRTQGMSGWVPQDPDDDKFIETALIGGAGIIVSVTCLRSARCRGSRS